MSPEQCLGSAIDPRSDVYACGVVLYQLLTGKPPFTGNTPAEILFKQTDDPPLPPTRLRRTLHPLLEAVVLRALAKTADARQQTARQLRQELEALRPELSSAVPGEPSLPVLFPPEESGDTDVVPVTDTTVSPIAPEPQAASRDRQGPSDSPPPTHRSVALARHAGSSSVSKSNGVPVEPAPFDDEEQEGSRLWMPVEWQRGDVESPTAPRNSAATRAAKAAARRASILEIRRRESQRPLRRLRAIAQSYWMVLVVVAAVGVGFWTARILYHG